MDLARRSVPLAAWADSQPVPIEAVAFDRSGTRVLVAERSFGTRLLDAETGVELGMPVTEGTRSASFVQAEGDSGDPRIAVLSSGWLRTMNGPALAPSRWQLVSNDRPFALFRLR